MEFVLSILYYIVVTCMMTHMNMSMCRDCTDVAIHYVVCRTRSIASSEASSSQSVS